MINYGYALLESECLRVINSVGLDYHFGFLHKMKKNVEAEKPFSLNAHVRERLEMWH